jgi:threonine synthase
MKLVSTRGQAPPVPLGEALARGLAPDGGLYIPPRLPRLSSAQVQALAQAPPARVAEAILRPFLEDPADAPLRDALPLLADHAFAPPLHLRSLTGEVSLLELWHGPTAAFKDFAARFLARALAVRGSALGAPPPQVLVATSGDTGSAVAAAFEAEPGFRVRVLFPAEGVSSRQAHLLSCFGPRVRSHAVAGSFDEAQQMAKAALGDPDLVSRHRLTSANSISIGRLLPQATWFAWASLARPGVGFVIPSGNFGHGLAALWARAMGFPVGPVHLATNRNRALVDWFEKGEAAPRKSVRTPANAMDVGVPSNLERLRAQGSEGLGARASAVEDEAIVEAVARAPERWGVVVCPHTACALHALDSGEAGPAPAAGWIVAGTAHPAKFPEVVEPATGQTVPLPPALATLLERPARATPLAASDEALQEALASGDTGG